MQYTITFMRYSYSKEISNWLKRDDTWELVVAVADDLGILPNSSKNTDSYKTRVSASYSGII